MSCGPTPGTYRLLDRYVGWESVDVAGLDGLDGEGLELAPVEVDHIDLSSLSALLAPPGLARGCAPCEWYLADPAAPEGRVLRRTACEPRWHAIWPIAAPSSLGVSPVAVAVSGHRLAIVDRARSRVEVVTDSGERILASLTVDSPSAVAFDPSGDIWVVVGDGKRLSVHDPSGLWRHDVDPGLDDPIDRLVFGPSQPPPADADPERSCALWLATLGPDGGVRLWRAGPDGSDPRPTTLADLAAVVTPTGVVAADETGFCLTDESDRGSERCFDWSGNPVDPGRITHPAPERRVEQGQLLTRAIDSGLARCQWHRVRIDADVPVGTALSIAVSSSEVVSPAPQGDVAIDDRWQDFDPGVPHPVDWQTVTGGVSGTSLDTLVSQPPGRYLFVRIRLQGDGSSTPTVRRVRLDLPRSSGLDSLPAIYRSDPAAAEFTERFLSLFDAELEEIDRLVERHPALLDAQGVPPEVLTWLAELVGVSFNSDWNGETRRALIAAAPELYRTRGTPAGLREAVRIIFGVELAIEELGPNRPWGVVASADRTTGSEPLGARLRQVRLFGRSRGRVRLGTSMIGRAPIRSFGNPDDDPRQAGAFRIRVLVPSLRKLDADRQATFERQLRELVAALTPAHVVADIRFGDDGLLVGAASAVGIDTVFAPLPAPVLGQNVRLGRRTVLWPSRRGPTPGIALDDGATVGTTTYLE